MNTYVSKCRHQQADTVKLSTGEIVACVCIECYVRLVPGYIERQCEEAHRRAFCGHNETFEIRDMAQPNALKKICQDCYDDDFTNELIASMVDVIKNPKGAHAVRLIPINTDEG